MPRPPPRQHKHERQYTPSTHCHPKRRIWNNDYDGRMILGDLGGLKLPDTCLTGEEKPRKNLTHETCPDLGSNRGPLRDKRTCYHLLHSGGRTLVFMKISKGLFMLRVLQNNVSVKSLLIVYKFIKILNLKIRRNNPSY